MVKNPRVSMLFLLLITCFIVQPGNIFQIPHSFGEQHKNGLSDNNNGLQIVTGKKVFVPGQTMNITVVNTSGEIIRFADLNLGVIIKSTDSNAVIEPKGIKGQSIVELPPNSSQSISVILIDTEGSPAPPGNYSINFDILGENPPIIESNNTFLVKQ